jgi:hypothetical protein
MFHLLPLVLIGFDPIVLTQSLAARKSTFHPAVMVSPFHATIEVRNKVVKLERSPVPIARKQRGGEDWFIGSMTNEKRRDFDLPLNFLAKNKTYVAELYRDGDDADWKTNPIDYKIEKRLVTRDSILSFHLAPGGGEAIRLKPATPEEQTNVTKG